MTTLHETCNAIIHEMDRLFPHGDHVISPGSCVIQIRSRTIDAHLATFPRSSSITVLERLKALPVGTSLQTVLMMMV